MLEAAGGGGYGGTDWSGKNVIEMWQAVEGQNTAANYDVLGGWQKSYELLGDHMSQVQQYRDSLATVWPPEKSQASAAYLKRLDDLISYLQNTYDTSTSNHDALASATLSIGLSRQQLQPIYEEYVGNQQKLDTYNQQLAATKTAAATPTSNSTPTPAPSPGPTPTPPPPVSAGRQEQLTNQARAIMFSLSSDIGDARIKLVTPPSYVLTNRSEGGDKQNGQVFVPPAIPAVTPYDPGSSTGASQSNGHSSAAASSAVPPLSSPSPQQPGLVLGGTGQTATPPPVAPSGLPPASSGGPAPAGPLPPTIFPPVGGGAGGIPPLGGGLPGSGSGGLPGSRFPSGSPSGLIGEGPGRIGPGGIPEGGLRAMPPGGVIGTVPGGALGQPSPGGRLPSRVNPVGGVIGSESEGGMGAGARGGGIGVLGRGGSGAAGEPIGTLGARGNRHPDDDDNLHWDPDNPWETTQGVAPVLTPGAEQRIDPGPAIGLH